MSAYRIKIAQEDFDELQRLVSVDLPKEAGAFALAGVADHSAGTDVIVRRPLAIPQDRFLLQHELRLEVSSEAVNGLISLCEANRLGAVLCHSHPRDIPYSPSDDHGEHRIFTTLHQFIPAHAPTASLLFCPHGVQGRIWTPGAQKPVPASEIVVVGRQLRTVRPLTSGDRDHAPLPDIFSRQVLAFGPAGQRRISKTKVGIVGVGGTGSAAAELLVRLGVGDFVLIDPDKFEPSNLTRMFGTYASATRSVWWWPWTRRNHSKVELVAHHLSKINPQALTRVFRENVVVDVAAKALLDRDVVFLCTDDHWGRSIVNQIAYQYLIPTINVGMRIASKEGVTTAATGVVDVLRPDTPCLWCKQFLRADRIAAESMPRADRQAREREGYVEGLDTPNPSVVSVNTGLASMAVTLFLQLLTDFMGDFGVISRLNYDILETRLNRGTTPIAKDCICTKSRGFGDLRPLNTVANLGGGEN